MVIYLDIYFLKNAIFNFLLIYLTSLIIRKKIKIYKAIIAACIGGVYAIIALYHQEIFNSALLKISISLLMLMISFGKKEMITIFSSFLVLAYFIAGMIASILNVNSQFIMMLCAISNIIIFYIYIKKQKQNECYEITLEMLENEIEIIAKLDTGNELKDALFGDPVIVVAENRAKKEFDDELIKILNNEKLEIKDRYKNKIKLISFKTISGEGIKIGIKLDNVIIHLKEKNIESKAIMIISERNFKGYDALIGKSLLEGGYEYENISFNKIKNKRAL